MSLFSFQELMREGGSIITKANSNALFLIRCAHEIQDVRVMELLASFACKENDEEYKTFCLEDVNIAPVESTALFEFLSFMKNLQSLNIHSCLMEDLVIREMVTKLLIEKSDNCKLTKLDWTKYLSDALKSDNCKLTKLDIRNEDR